MFTIKENCIDYDTYYFSYPPPTNETLSYEDCVLNDIFGGDYIYFEGSEYTEEIENQIILRGTILDKIIKIDNEPLKLYKNFKIILNGVEISKDFTVTVKLARCNNDYINDFLQKHIVGTFKVNGNQKVLSSLRSRFYNRYTDNTIICAKETGYNNPADYAFNVFVKNAYEIGRNLENYRCSH